MTVFFSPVTLFGTGVTLFGTPEKVFGTVVKVFGTVVTGSIHGTVSNIFSEEINYTYPTGYFQLFGKGG